MRHGMTAMRRGVGAVLSITLAWSGVVAVTPATAAPSTNEAQLTLARAAISGSVTQQNRQRVTEFLIAHPSGTSLTCTARHLSGATARRVAQKAAKAVCAVAQSQRSDLSIQVRTQATKNRADAGSVRLTVRLSETANPGPQPDEEKPEVDARDYRDALPAEKTISALRTHIQALDRQAQQLTPMTLDFTAGPTTDPEAVRRVVDTFAAKLKLFQLVGLERLTMSWVIASEKDYAWWRDRRLAELPNYPVSLWDTAANELGHCRLDPTVFCGAGHAIGGRTYQDNVVGTAFVDRGLNYVARHESAHFYQGVFGYGSRCWFAEGQATFFETYLETTSRSRDMIISQLKVNPTGVAQLSQAELQRRIADNSICTGSSNIAYELGMLAMEYLYMNYSFQKIHELQSQGRTMSWDQGVREFLGADPQVINAGIAAHIARALT